jgi:hypothetical protein
MVLFSRSQDAEPPMLTRSRVFTVVAIAALLIAIYFPNYTHRFRLTVEIDTSEGVRRGSSVIEVERKDRRWSLIGGYNFQVRGQAVFVDLGAGRNAIVLLAHGGIALDGAQMISLPIEAYGYYKWDEDAWADKKAMRGPVELRPPLIPTIVTTKNPSDLKQTEVIYATEIRDVSRPETAHVAIDRFSEVFGPTVRFRRALLEKVPGGYWPLNLIGITGTSLTRGLEQEVPALEIRRDELRNIKSTYPPRFEPHYGFFIRS